MSLSDVPGGVRLVYRGIMDLRRLQRLREVVGEDAWAAPGSYTLSRVDGRAEPLFECDMVVPRRRARGLLGALGSPLARKGLLARLLGL